MRVTIIMHACWSVSYDIHAMSAGMQTRPAMQPCMLPLMNKLQPGTCSYGCDVATLQYVYCHAAILGKL